MKELTLHPKRVEQVYDAILNEITDGRLSPGERVIQEHIAQELGVSRQPVQQALLLLRNKGVLVDAPGRGLIVAPLDLDYVQSMYEIRAVLEGLAFRNAAERNADQAGELGPALIQKGREAVKSKSVSAMIAADREFHACIYRLSENALIAPSMDAQWTSTQRVMGEVLMRDEKPRDIWDQHEAMLAEVARGRGAVVEELARQHVLQAANFMITRLRGQRDRTPADPPESTGSLRATG